MISYLSIHRFLEEYAKVDVDFWGVTAQNEPEFGVEPGIILYNGEILSIFTLKIYIISL